MWQAIRLMKMIIDCRTPIERGRLLDKIRKRGELASLRHAMEWLCAVGFISVQHGEICDAVYVNASGARFLVRASNAGTADATLAALPGDFIQRPRLRMLVDSTKGSV